LLRVATSISTVTSSAYGVVVADMHGSVHMLNNEFEPVSSWVAHVGGRVTHMVERREYLVTLGVRLLLPSSTRNSLDNVDVETVGRRRGSESPSQNLASGEDRQKRHAVLITLHQSADEQSAAPGAPFLVFFLLHDVLIRSFA
jgi:hypothetical protein